MGEQHEFETRIGGDLVELAVITDNIHHAPRVRWQIESSGATGDDGNLIISSQLHNEGVLAEQIAEPDSENQDFWEDDSAEEWDDRNGWDMRRWDEGGYVVEEPKLVFSPANPFSEVNEDPREVMVAGESRTQIELPRQLAFNLYTKMEQLSIATTDSESVCSDPSVFPSQIADLRKDNWDADRNVMWYSDGDSDRAIPYQIEDSELIQRPYEALLGDHLSTI